MRLCSIINSNNKIFTMTNKENEEHGKDDAPGQNKEVDIVVNGTDEKWNEKEIGYKQVVLLAFPNAKFEANNEYTVNYEKGQGNKEGSLVTGQSVKVKSEMEFDVDPTTKS